MRKKAEQAKQAKRAKRASVYFDEFPNRRIRELSANMKSKDLAELISELSGDSVTSEAIRQWRSGYVRPDMSKLRAIAKALNCTTDYLLGLEDQPSHESADISVVTGLSDLAIQILKYHRNHRELDIGFVNFLIEQEIPLAIWASADRRKSESDLFKFIAERTPIIFSLQKYFQSDISEELVYERLNARPITKDNLNDVPIAEVSKLDFRDVVTQEVFSGLNLRDIVEQAYFNRLHSELQKLRDQYRSKEDTSTRNSTTKECDIDGNKE